MAVLTSSTQLAKPHLPQTAPVSAVTIVIPVFNQLHYTRQCLENLNQASIAEQAETRAGTEATHRCRFNAAGSLPRRATP